MSKVKRDDRMRVKRFLHRELAEFYGCHRNSVPGIIGGYDLRTVEGSVMAIREMDKWAKYNRRGDVEERV